MKLSNESVVVELKNSTVVQAPPLVGLRTFDSVKQRTRTQHLELEVEGDVLHDWQNQVLVKFVFSCIWDSGS